MAHFRRRPHGVRHRATSLLLVLGSTGSAFMCGSSWRPLQRGQDRGVGIRVQEEDAQAVLQEAKRLRGEAEAESALLEARRRLRETKESAEAGVPQDDPELEAQNVARLLEEAEAKLRKAEAFKLPERTELKEEVRRLQDRAAELKQSMASPEPTPAPQPVVPPIKARSSTLNRAGKPMEEWSDADWEDLATTSQDMSVQKRFDLAQALGRDGRKRLSDVVAKREEEARAEAEAEEEQIRKKQEEDDAAYKEKVRNEGKELREKLTFEKLKEMTNEERIELASALGPAYITSLGIVAACYWALNVPFLIYAYHESTGQWPDLGLLNNLDSLSTAGIFASVFAVYALMKPVRFFVALLLTPFTLENIMPNLPRMPDPGDGNRR